MTLTPKLLPALAETVNARRQPVVCHLRGYKAKCLLVRAFVETSEVEVMRVRDGKRKRFALEAVELDRAI